MPRPEIIDQFTSLNVSRQRKWALRRKAQKLCVICGRKAINKNHCEEHTRYANERQNRINQEKKTKESLKEAK